MQTVHFKGPHCKGEVQSLGAMLGPVYFDLGENHLVQPFAIAPWGDAPVPNGEPELPGVLRRLRGEWPCVPFGAPGNAAQRSDLPPDWQAGYEPCPATLGEDFHGFGSNQNWAITSQESGVFASIDYPPSHAIQRVERLVWADAEQPTLHCELIVHPRANCRMPVGLHPVFRVPMDANGTPGALNLTFSEANLRAWSFPVDVEPGRSVLRPDQRNKALTDLQDRAGAAVDPLSLPFRQAGEDLLLLTGFTRKQSSVQINNLAEGYAITLEWCSQDLPSCLLWISHFGRDQFPWNGRFCAIGIEPIAAPFDLGPTHTAETLSPFAQAGVRTAVDLQAELPWRTRYSMHCKRLPTN